MRVEVRHAAHRQRRGNHRHQLEMPAEVLARAVGRRHPETRPGGAHETEQQGDEVAKAYQGERRRGNHERFLPAKMPAEVGGADEGRGRRQQRQP